MQTMGNLPPQPTPFIGRVTELNDLKQLLAEPTCRLLTLIGPGGIGKTRLALELAAQLADAYGGETYFVPLQAVSNPEFVLTEIAGALGFPLLNDSNIEAQLIAYLRDRRALLVLDNFEHLLAGAEIISRLIAGTTSLSLIVTSREALNLQEEWVRPVGGMAYPSREGVSATAPMKLEDYSAIQLFAHHARRVRAGFSLEANAGAIRRICQMLEGMPLALELAASWLKTLSCDQIASGIENNLDFLVTDVRNVPVRHRSMRAVFDHAWASLQAEERAILKRLSVFWGSFNLSAAATVAGASPRSLGILADKSLLQVKPADQYALHELLRQYAGQLLAASPEEQIETQRRHTDYFLHLLREEWSHLLGPDCHMALGRIGSALENIRAAWKWAAEHGLLEALSMATPSLWFFFNTCTRYQEGIRTFQVALAALQDGDTGLHRRVASDRIKAYLGVLYMAVNRPEQARALLAESLITMRQASAQAETAFILHRLGELAMFTFQPAEAHRLFDESLAISMRLSDDWSTGNTLLWQSIVAANEGQAMAAWQYCQQSRPYIEPLGNPWLTAQLLATIAGTEWGIGHAAEVVQPAKRCIEICNELGLEWLKFLAYMHIGEAYFELRKRDEAQRAFCAAIQLATRYQLLPFTLWSLVGPALLLAEGSALEREQAVEMLAFALAHPAMAFGRVELNRVINQMEGALPASVFTAAVERSRSLNLDQIVAGVLERFCQPQNDHAASANSPVVKSATLAEPLTTREIEILKRIANGQSNQTIADELMLSLGTVKWYANQIYGKLNVSSRTQAIASARSLHLLD